jgi:hypothetical protein
LGLIYSLWIMPKGMPATITMIAVYHHLLNVWVTQLFFLSSPALQDVISATWTFFWSTLGFSLDIWEFQDNNRHGKLFGIVV